MCGLTEQSVSPIFPSPHFDIRCPCQGTICLLLPHNRGYLIHKLTWKSLVLANHIFSKGHNIIDTLLIFLTAAKPRHKSLSLIEKTGRNTGTFQSPKSAPRRVQVWV